MASYRLGQIVDVLAIGLIVVAASFLLTRHIGHDHEDDDFTTDLPSDTRLTLEAVPTLGSARAPIVMVEFSDFQCSFCIRYSRDTFPRIRERLIDTGRVQYGFIHSPVAARHPQAPELSKLAVCAARQGLFWEAHERLFGVSSSAKVAAELSRLGLNEQVQTRCLQDASAGQIVDRDLRTAARLGVSGTPTFIIGRRMGSDEIRWLRRIKGAQAFSVFLQQIADAEAGPATLWGDIATRLMQPLPGGAIPLLLLPVWLLLVVVVHHRWRVRKHGQSSWKGGGFGMFSDLHRSASTAVLSVRETQGDPEQLRIDTSDWMTRHNVIPNGVNLRRWGEQILQGRWMRSGARALPLQPGHDARALDIEAVTLKHLAIDFDRRTGTYTGRVDTVVTLEHQRGE
jgi:protein-disulfide isomerase